MATLSPTIKCVDNDNEAMISNNEMLAIVITVTIASSSKAMMTMKTMIRYKGNDDSCDIC